MDRREFVKLSLTTALVSSGGSQSLFAGKSGEMQYRTLGRTGEKVSIVGLGGYHIGMQQDASESIRIIRTALDHGMNFMDNCWDYNDGESEVRMGKALQNGYRQRAFLMTKIDGRDHKTAAQQD
jgi:aryl-alcohol dehydrogenase-like predicted oxidoreductase